MLKKITKKEWSEFVAKNADCSYGLVVCLGILMLWEAGVKDEKDANEKLLSYELGGLSGAQAEMIIGMAITRDADEWLDDIAKSVSRGDA